MTALKPGEMAPDFDLPVLVGGVKKRFRLGEHRGKRSLVLAFYPINWEPVSAEQMVAYQVEREKFTARNAEIVGISVDSIMNTTAWERELGPFDFSICSDFWPHGEVCRKYGVLRETEPFAGASARGIRDWQIRQNRIQQNLFREPGTGPARNTRSTKDVIETAPGAS